MSVLSLPALSASVPTAVVADAPQLKWNISSDVQDVARKVSFGLMALWVIVFAAQFAIPSRRAGMGGRIGIGKFIGAAAICVILMDLDLFTRAINNLLTGIWSLWGMFDDSNIS